MKRITFVHLADCHLGSWRDQKLRDLGFACFETAILDAIQRKVDFILISGDLFNTALPAIDILKQAVSLFRRVKQNNIPVYFIAGSHDYSPAGKTMLHIIEEAGLARNVMHGAMSKGQLVLAPTIDERTGVSLCGILGRAQSLDQQYYELLNRETLQAIAQPKIFLFHCAISELKPKSMADTPSAAISFLPAGFDYYAGGHVHYRFNQDVKPYGKIVYPGPTFPNNFAEIEDLQCGSYVVGTIDVDTRAQKPVYQTFAEHILIPSPKTISLTIDCDGDTPSQINAKLDAIDKKSIEGKIVLLRMRGTVKGSLSDIKLSEWMSSSTNAFTILKNTFALESEQFKAQVPLMSSTSNVEDEILKQSLEQSKIVQSKELMQALHTQKQDGETKDDFERRIVEAAFSILGIKKE